MGESGRREINRVFTHMHTQTDNPVCMVVEFGLACTVDNVGDPLVIMVPPIEQYFTSNAYVIN